MGHFLTFSARRMELSKGGLSPILFCMYPDELLNQINESGIGCHIGYLSFAGLGYADDVGILSPSVEALQELLHICEKYADEFNVIFNTKKTMCMCISGRVQPPSRHVTLNGPPLRWTNKAKYLGNLVNSSFNDCEDIRMKTGSFISQVNKLNNKFSFVSSNVKAMAMAPTLCNRPIISGLGPDLGWDSAISWSWLGAAFDCCRVTGSLKLRFHHSSHMIRAERHSPLQWCMLSFQLSETKDGRSQI